MMKTSCEKVYANKCKDTKERDKLIVITKEGKSVGPIH